MDKPIKILYADSDPVVQEAIRAKIEQCGWSGDPANSASDIVNQINYNCLSGTGKYDAVVTALSFFDTNEDAFFTGITAAKMIRKVRDDVPIVFLSEYNNSIIREEVRRVDGEIVPKPLDVDQLFTRLQELIEWSHEAHSNTYEGENRRTHSINRTENFRRRTDQYIDIPERLQQVRDEIKEQQFNERGFNTETNGRSD